VAPLLTILVPTFNRAGDLARLLACLDAEIPSDDVTVLVSDNASDDETPELLAGAAAARPWLTVHRQGENVGPFRNVEWLVENAPACGHLWLFGDDDLLVPGSLAAVLRILRDEQPAWLFLPHLWIGERGEEIGGSPAPGAVERYASAGDLYRAYHHWLTFLTGSIVRRDAFRDAVREVRTDNAYAPLLWFFRAGLDGPCVVAADHVLRASQAISWGDKAHVYQTLHFTSLYDEGLHEGISEEDFGRSLDGLYRDGWGLNLWQQVPVERLAETVERFPQSEGLRSYLWQIARERSWSDAVPVLDAAARAAGAEPVATALVEEGEELFAAGAVHAAAERFGAAAHRMPTLAAAWNDLAVALHHLGSPDALAAVEAALFVAPDDEDAQLNRASILAASG
jgi:glycosyltransferase involved in cell wall biosynthesis